MSRLSHSEIHMVHRIGWLRAAVLGANDGLVSTASLVVGVAAAGSGKPEVLIAGLAGLVAGAMSMAAGEYVSVSSQTDAENADLARETLDSFAKARFSSRSVHMTARVAEGLPRDWALRTLTGLEALTYLSNGAVTVTPDQLTVVGDTGRQDASAEISGFLAGKLGEGSQFSIDVTYKEALDPIASIPTPEECEERIASVQTERKINFEPGSSTIDGNGAAIMDDIAEILQECGDIRIEIGGHTDSQGREEMNERLSQERAQAVLNELRLRRVLTSSFTAKGYGESQPIADNDTEEGREANRRIEFRLLRPKPIEESETTLESLEEPREEDNGSTSAEQEVTTEEQN